MSIIDLKAIKVGDKIRFAEEKPTYKVRARNERFIICTRPFNPKRTVIYSIMDVVDMVRGPDNMIFGRAFETDEDIAARLSELASGEIEVSSRRGIDLHVAAVNG